MYNINPYGWPPPVIMGQPDQQKYIEYGMRQAEKLMHRERREKERQDNLKKKAMDDARKHAKEARSRLFTALEWFIIGVISYPIVGPLYNVVVKSAQTYGAQ